MKKNESSALQINVNNLFFYTVYALSPGSIKDPENAEEVNIRVTHNISDESQKNFEMLVQSIGLRTMPIVIESPMATRNLAIVGAPSLAGEGFVWKFAVEVPYIFEKKISKDPVGLLKDELNGIVLSNGVVLKTSGVGLNIEFKEG